LITFIQTSRIRKRRSVILEKYFQVIGFKEIQTVTYTKENKLIVSSVINFIKK